MNFANPSGLWWLAAVPLVVLLYWLRPQRRDVVVSSLLLWRRSLGERSRRALLRRLQRDVLLWLQVLTVCVGALALARPLRPLPPGAQDLVVVLDAGIRMQAQDISPSRFEAARRAALDLVATGEFGRVAVVVAARHPRVLQPLTASRSAAVGALRAASPTDGPSDLEAALRLAASLSPLGRSAQVHVFSDRPVQGAHSHVFGGRLDDVSVVGVVASPFGQGRQRVAVRVRNDSPRPRRLEVSVQVDGQPAARLPLWLPPGGEGTARAVVRAGQLVEATVPSQDLLPTNDRFLAAGASAPRPSVLLVGPGDPFLEHGLRVLAGRVDRQEVPQPQTWSGSEVVVAHRVALGSLPPGSYLLVRASALDLPLRVRGTVSAPEVVRQAQTHPLLRFVDLSSVHVRRAWDLEVRGGEVLVEAAAPLVWAYEDEGVRVVLVAFDLRDSDFGLRPAFPIFLANALDWLAGPAVRTVEAGTALSVPSGAQRVARLVGPGGAVTLQAQGGRFLLPAFDRTGVYRLESGPLRRWWAVHPGPAEVRGPAGAGVGALRGVDQTAEWTPLLLGCLAALLGAEWWLFTRRRGPAGGAR
jgi:Ca-activated chloride channel family protein